MTQFPRSVPGLPWKPPGRGTFSDEQQLVVAYDRQAGVLRIDHVEKSGSTTKHVCTRA
ncbi:hypothetical protein ACWD4V_04195 [Streptomyces tsukubensis]|uniref:hypothetical protein n=1 Tax=Streptomyces tsukubensis TaxID=83656 RepID=UPI0036C41F64